MTGRVFDFPGATVALLSFSSTHLHGFGINFRLPGVIEYGWFSHVFHISIDMDHLLAEKIRCSRFAGTHMYLRIQHIKGQMQRVTGQPMHWNAFS